MADSTTEAPARRTSKRPAAPVSAHSLRGLGDSVQTCVHCRKNKLKCNAERPQCSACASRNASCEYDEPARAPSTRAAPATTASTSRKRPAPTSTYAQIKESRQRKRAAAAQTSCDFCRNDLRRKCDGLRPSCQSCIKRGEPCVYSGPASIPMTGSSSNVSLSHMTRSDDEDSDAAMPSRSHSPDVPLADSASPSTPLDPNRPRYPQGNGLGHAGSTRNPDGTNCTRPVACFFCIKVELPCTGDFPTCVNCVRRTLQCTYPDPSSYAHQFPRQSAMHTRQLKDGPTHRSSASGIHTSPGRGQLTPSLHPSRSNPGPLNQTQNHVQPGHTSPPMSASNSPDSMTHTRQRSMSGPNGFGSEVRSSTAGMDNVPRSTAGSRPAAIASPARLPNSSASHSRAPSSAAAPTSASSGQPTLSNPIPLPAPRSTAQSPATLIQPLHQTPITPIQNHNQLPNQNQNASPAERVLDTVRGQPGDVRSPVNGVIVSPSGRTRDASIVHGAHSRSGSTSGQGQGQGQQGDGFVHAGPASYRARMGEGETSGNSTPYRNGVLPTSSTPTNPTDTATGAGTPTRISRPVRPPDQEDEPAPNTNDVSAPIESRADPNPGSGMARVGTDTSHRRLLYIETIAGPRAGAPGEAPVSGENGAVTASASASAPAAAANPPTKTGSGPEPRSTPTNGTTDTRSPVEDTRRLDESRPRFEPRTDEPRPRPVNSLPLPDSLPRRPSVPSPITQHPARDLSIIAPMAPMMRQDISRRDSGDRSGRYDPRRDTGDRWDIDRRDSTSSDRRGSTSGRDPVNNWQPAPRANTQPRPVPTIDTRGSSMNARREQSPHTPRSMVLELRDRRERSPPRKSKSPVRAGTPPRSSRTKRRSQSPRGLYLRAESGSIRSSPMDMDSS